MPLHMVALTFIMEFMRVISRLLCTVLTLALVFGVMLHSANANDMMSMAMSGSVDQPMSDDCNKGCGGDDMAQATGCIAVCIVNPAMLPSTPVMALVPANQAVAGSPIGLTGRDSIPEPYPPKSLILV